MVLMRQTVTVTEISLPPSIKLEYDQEPDGRWRAVIAPENWSITAYGNTKDEAAGHAIELLLNVLAERLTFLEERVSLADYLASLPVEDEELKPEFAAELDRIRASNELGIPHDEFMRELGFKP